jgi:hypothetical protein
MGDDSAATEEMKPEPTGGEAEARIDQSRRERSVESTQ